MGDNEEEQGDGFLAKTVWCGLPAPIKRSDHWTIDSYYSYYTIFLDEIDGGNNEADSSSVACNMYSFFSRSTACFRLSDALKSNYLNWGTGPIMLIAYPTQL